MVLGLPGRDPVTEAWLTELLGALALGPSRVQRYQC